MARELRHVVCLRFKEGTPAESIDALERSFVELASTIPVIKGFEWGLNNSTEGFSKGCSHAFLLTFASEEDRDEYLGHPNHLAFVESKAKPILEDILVVDYWATSVL